MGIDHRRLQRRERVVRFDDVRERVALLKALSDGHRTFTMIAVVADTSSPTPPCGPCRQLLWEYCGDIPVVMANLTAISATYQMKELLPLPFDGRLLK